MILVCVRCAVCGCSQFIEANPGTVRHVTIEHENDCAFLAAVEGGDALAYVAANGYPITYEPQSAAGAA